ncbi:hypothetical protein PR048_029339 [Dryococelus australis]|uniref:Uncharacterized protein n=1 Tax=Dryococelus australis TaxID=614101 RepID=A0ABQ9GDG4_9NEOP|nr:hypothetical protein PR048_029339 [Dryococelus australis]
MSSQTCEIRWIENQDSFFSLMNFSIVKHCWITRFLRPIIYCKSTQSSFLFTSEKLKSTTSLYALSMYDPIILKYKNWGIKTPPNLTKFFAATKQAQENIEFTITVKSGKQVQWSNYLTKDFE